MATNRGPQVGRHKPGSGQREGAMAVPLPVFQARALVPSRLQVQNAKSRFGQRQEVRVGPAWSLYTHPSIRACMSGSRASSFVRQHSNSV